MLNDPTVAHRTLPAPALPPPSMFAPGTSQWWLDRMFRALVTRQARMRTLRTYYRGENKTAQLASAAYREAGLDVMFPDLGVNHSKLIVDSATERLVVQGFRMPDEFRTDGVLARIWASNDMDAMSDLAHNEALVKGECPVLVEPDALTGKPRITPLDPLEAIVWYAPTDRRIRLAALRTWWDDVLRRRVYNLYLPDRIEFWQDRQQGQMSMWMDRLFGGQTQPFERRPMPAGQRSVIANPLGAVPVVTLFNEPQLDGAPSGEHEAILGLNDLYNKTLMDMTMTSHELAYPQRTATGIDAEEDVLASPELGEPAAGTQARVQTGQGRMVTASNPEARFGQFQAADLGGYVVFLDKVRFEEASITRTPYHYLIATQTSNPQSGEAMTVAETAFVDKITGHQRDMSPGWLEVGRLALLIADESSRAEALRSGGTVAWKDPERRTEAQHVDALSKMFTFGVPERALWELTGATPATLARWEQMKKEEPPAPAAAPSQPPSGAGNPQASTD